MSARHAVERLRLTVEGVEDAIFEWDPADVASPDARDPEVRPARVSAADRAAGRERFEVTVDGWVFRVGAEAAARAELRARASHAAEYAAQGGSVVVKAQIPGRVARLWVVEGDTVEAGQRLLAIEAMKMENEVRAPRAGTVEAVRVVAGAGVELSDELLTIA